MSFKTLSEQLVGLGQRVMGDDVTYSPAAGSPVTIQGIFDNAWVDIEGVLSLKPTLRINLADLASAPDKGDEVTVDEVDYRVTESRVDGHGGSTLILHKA